MQKIVYTNSCDGYHDSCDIRFTKKCDNNCSFCIEKKGIPSLGETNVDKLVESTIETTIKNILILGGEPFLEIEKLYEYVQRIRPYVKNIYITTSLPYIITKNFDLFVKIVRLIDGLNISVHSIDTLENEKIFNSSNPHNRIALLTIISRMFADKIRISQLLTKYITKEKLINTIKFYKSIGIKWIKIAEIQNSGTEYVNFEKLFNIKLPTPYACGCQTDIDSTLFGVDNIRITLKRSCFKVEKTLDATFLDIIKVFKLRNTPYRNKFKVIYENGDIYNEWKKQ